MSEKSWREIKQEFYKNIRNYRIYLAIDQIKQLQSCFGDFSCESIIDNCQRDFDNLSSYALQGVEDAKRDFIIEDIVYRLYTAADVLSRNYLAKHSTKLYYQTYNSFVDCQRTFDVSDSNVTADNSDTFNYAWTRFPLNNDDVDNIKTILESDIDQKAIISAIMLGHIRYPDHNRLVLLLYGYQKCRKRRNRLQALTAFLISAFTSKERNKDFSLAQELIAINDVIPQLKNDIRDITSALISTHRTERINKMLDEKVLPQLMNHSDDIKRIMGEMQENADYDPDFNPEWSEIFEQSGVADDMRKIADLQTQGGDVMMSTFSRLKHFPFFNDIVNWFVPFRETALQLGENRDIVELIAQIPSICDSDRFSMLFSMSLMPGENLNVIKDNFEEYVNHQNEEDSTEIADVNRQREYILYIQDLYRFFKLFSRHEQQLNPFTQSLNMFDLIFLHPFLADNVFIDLAAELYIKSLRYKDAIDIYTCGILSSLGPVNNQRLGYCYQRLGATSDAIRHYVRANLQQPDNRWTLDHLAHCLVQINDLESASDCYRKLSELDPDNIDYIIDYANILYKMGNNTEATKQYYKAFFYNENNIDALKGLMNTSFKDANFEKSDRFADLVINHHQAQSSDRCHALVYKAIHYFVDGEIAECLNSLDFVAAQGMLDDAKDIVYSDAIGDVITRLDVDHGLIDIMFNQLDKKYLLNN